MQIEDNYINISYGKLHYIKRNAEGIPRCRIIFLHGLGASVRVWTRLFEYMPEEFELIAVDLPGHGESDAPHIEYAIEKNVQLFKEFVDAAEIKDFCLFGHSLGGWISALYAARFKVKALILEAPAGLKEEFDRIRETNTVEEHKLMVMRAAESVNSNKDYVIQSILNSDNTASELTEKTLGLIKAKTLILWGTEDNIVSPDLAHILLRMIKNCELCMLEGAGHVPHYTKSDEIAEVVTAFLA